MSVHQLKDGRWYVEYRDKSKKSGRAREYFGRGLEAEKQARERNESLSLRPYTPSTPSEGANTLNDLAESYIQAKIGSMQKTSLDALNYKLQSIILPELGHRSALRITDSVMDRYVAKRLNTDLTVWAGPKTKKKIVLDKNGMPKKISRSTVHRELTDIIAILNWSVKRKYIKVNPLAGYEKPKKDNAVIEPPTMAEIQALLQHSAAHLRRCLVISFYTGLRPGQTELLSLKWNAVDLRAKTILIRSSRKGGPISRTVPIHTAFLKLLKKWKKEDKDKTAEEIITYKGQPVQRIKKAFYAAKKRAGITRRLRAYDFRHAFATMLLSEAGDLKSTSEILGHSRIQTTMDIYQHTNSKMHRKTINKLPALTVPD